MRDLVFIAGLLLLLANPVWASSDDAIDELALHAAVPETQDLMLDANEAFEKRAPILLLVSQEHCDFCEVIKEEILQPMMISGDYDDRLVIRQIQIDSGSNLKDFSGNERGSDQLALDYGVQFTPTLLFLGPDGRELTKRMIGLQTPEMYAWYVDKSIATATRSLQQQIEISVNEVAR